MTTPPPLEAPSPAFLESLAARLGPGGALAPDEGHLTEPRGAWRGAAAMLARPATPEACAEVVRRCAEARVAVTPWAGGTGLVGGQIRPESDGPPCVVLSVERMTRVRAASREDDALIVDAGVVLTSVQEAARDIGRLFPLSLASEGSARIGGLLATNAGGVTVLRYGSARDLCLGIEAAMPDGSLFHGLKTLRKDNTGFDLRNLLIGSEGALGVITGAALKLFARPAETATALIGVESPEASVELLRRVQDRLGEAVTAFELMGAQGLAFLEAEIENARPPFAAPWTVLAEVGGAAVREAFETVLMDAFEAGLVGEAVLAESQAQAAALWRLREEIPTANRKIGALASHDVSVPISRIAGFIARAGAALESAAPGLRINCFGHIGDGNLHYNLFPPEAARRGPARAEWTAQAPALTRLVHDMVMEEGGSFSAEHGVGRLKTGDLERYGDPAKLAAMRAVKTALDPHWIMNPGAVLADPRTA